MQKPFRVQVGDRIKDVRGRLTQEQFARMLGVKQNYVCRYEKGRIPAPELLLKIAHYGKVTVDWLLTGRQRKFAGELHETYPLYGRTPLDRGIQELLSWVEARHKKAILRTLKGIAKNRSG